MDSAPVLGRLGGQERLVPEDGLTTQLLVDADHPVHEVVEDLKPSTRSVEALDRSRTSLEFEKPIVFLKLKRS